MIRPRLGARLGCGAAAFVRAAPLVCAAAFSMLAPPSASAADEPHRTYAAELIAAAERADLASERVWHALLHYEDDALTPGVTSLADGEKFFLAADGRTNPRAELAATLSAFADPRARTLEGEDPRCAFPARYRWLDERLGFDAARMPAAPSCDTFVRWMEGMRPGGLTLVFPEAYINNPASMFGHTLLRVDGAGEAAGRDMLAYAVNFAAETGGDGGAAFAFKGLTGFYPGYFSVLPYYQKLKQYGDWENRDIWEYRLDFTADETRRVLEHVWELLGVSFPYYFFDDNCSFHLLALLEVVRPDLRLTHDFPLWAIPVDTVRTVDDERGLITDASWRPAPSTRLRHMGATLSDEDRRRARDISAGRTAPDGDAVESLPASRRAVVLRLAYDDLRYRYLAGDEDEGASRPRSLAILKAASRTAAEAPTVEEPPAPAVRPEHGHPSARIALGGGVRDDDEFVELRLRAVFHELTDPIAGYAPGAQIVLGDLALRWLPEDDRVRVEEVVAVDVTSIAARDEFLRPISWKVSTGLRTRMISDSADVADLDPEPVWRTDGGAGLAWAPVRNVLAFAFAEAVADVGGALDGDFALGPGAWIGLLGGDTADRMRTLIGARAAAFVLGDTTETFRVGATSRLSLTRRTALELDAGWEGAYGEDWLDARLTFKWYFRRDWNGD